MLAIHKDVPSGKVAQSHLEPCNFTNLASLYEVGLQLALRGHRLHFFVLIVVEQE